MKKNILSRFLTYSLLAAVLPAMVWSCHDEDSEEFENISLKIGPDYVVEVQDFDVAGAEDVVIDQKTGIITVVFPCGTDVSALTPQISLAGGASIAPASAQTINLSAPKEYTVVNGNIFKKYRVVADIRCVTAFLSHATSVAAILDDDEKAYAEWFFKQYSPDVAEFVSFQNIKDGSVDLSKYKTLTWYLDGNANEQFVMPQISVDAEVLSKVKDFFQGGGNLYLLGYAGRYMMELDRFPKDYFNMAIGNGPGFENGDTWSVGTNIMGQDASSHPLFSGIQLEGGLKTFPVIGPGWREDHNYVFLEIPAKYGMANNNIAAYNKFTEDHAARWLGVWGGIGDFFMVGVMELLPTGNFQGRIIYQGIGGIEWNQNKKGDINPAGANPHRKNIEMLAKNAISYLNVN